MLGSCLNEVKIYRPQRLSIKEAEKKTFNEK